MADIPASTIAFIAKLLDPLPDHAEPVESVSFCRDLARGTVEAWNAQARRYRDAASADRGRHLHMLMTMPAPSLLAIRFKEQNAKLSPPVSAWALAIEADRRRLGDYHGH